VIVIVIVGVIAPVIVAALVNGNDTVGVIYTVDRCNRRMGSTPNSMRWGIERLERIVATLTKLSDL
jgi:hypothetical protein